MSFSIHNADKGRAIFVKSVDPPLKDNLLELLLRQKNSLPQGIYLKNSWVKNAEEHYN